MSIWLPIDAYLGLSFSRGRLLEVPTYTYERLQRGFKCLRLEVSFLLHVHLILDLKRVRLSLKPAW